MFFLSVRRRGILISTILYDHPVLLGTYGDDIVVLRSIRCHLLPRVMIFIELSFPFSLSIDGTSRPRSGYAITVTS